MHHFIERRRGRPSYLIPILYFVFELVFGWLVIALMEWSYILSDWSMFGVMGIMAWVIFTVYKLIRVLKRQDTH